MIEFGEINGQIESQEQVSLTRSNSLKRRISQRISSYGIRILRILGLFSLVDMIETISININILIKDESNQLIHLKYPVRRKMVIQTVQRGQE